MTGEVADGPEPCLESGEGGLACGKYYGHGGEHGEWFNPFPPRRRLFTEPPPRRDPGQRITAWLPDSPVFWRGWQWGFAAGFLVAMALAAILAILA